MASHNNLQKLIPAHWLLLTLLAASVLSLMNTYISVQISALSKSCYYHIRELRLDLFAWCVRLISRLLVGFRTHLKSLHFYFILLQPHLCDILRKRVCRGAIVHHNRSVSPPMGMTGCEQITFVYDGSEEDHNITHWGGTKQTGRSLCNIVVSVSLSCTVRVSVFFAALFQLFFLSAMSLTIWNKTDDDDVDSNTAVNSLYRVRQNCTVYVCNNLTKPRSVFDNICNTCILNLGNLWWHQGDHSQPMHRKASHQNSLTFLWEYITIGLQLKRMQSLAWHVVAVYGYDRWTLGFREEKDKCFWNDSVYKNDACQL